MSTQIVEKREPDDKDFEILRSVLGGMRCVRFFKVRLTDKEVATLEEVE